MGGKSRRGRQVSYKQRREGCASNAVCDGVEMGGKSRRGRQIS